MRSSVEILLSKTTIKLEKKVFLTQLFSLEVILKAYPANTEAFI